MTCFRHLALVAVIFSSIAALPVAAQRVEYWAYCDITDIHGPAPEDYVPWGEDVYATYVFDLNVAPISVSATSATYPGIYGIGEFGTRFGLGYSAVLYNVTLTVTRDPTRGFYYYVFRGVSAEGWTFVHIESANDPSFVPSLALPTSIRQPERPDFPVFGDLDVYGPNHEWAAYSLDPLYTVQVVPVPGGLPSIVRQPDSAIVKRGRNAKFDIKVVSSTPLSYQWLKNGLPITGETVKKLSIKKAADSEDGIYQVLVGNDVGFVLSESVALTVD